MTDFTKSPPHRLGQLFSSLPRELRNHVFSYMMSDDSDFPLDISNSSIQVPANNPSIAAEWIEAAYTHRTCRVTFWDPTNTSRAISEGMWGVYPEYKHFIRRLIVDAPEASLYSEEDLMGVEYECTRREAQVRQEWHELLALTRLETLTIRLQKNALYSFSWANFSPIVYQLRERRPDLHVELYISFDMVLEFEWNVWQIVDENPDPWTTALIEPYLPMEYADVSELIQPPTAEDHEYVEEHLSGVREVGSQDIVRGLLDETPASRRQLAQHYLVKEPSLLRVLMAEHYELYKRLRRDRELLEVQVRGESVRT